MERANNYEETEPDTPKLKNSFILKEDDCYNCTKCPYPIEIISINEKNNTLTFKCLNPNKDNNHNIQTLPISEYINLMKKYSYLNTQCSICKKLKK